MTDPFDISVVTAVYDVARYLPEFAASLDAQTGIDLARVQVVAVDDGSTDDSLAWLRTWAERSALTVTVLTKENGGQGSARNLGLTVAQGTWITFTDPDDTLAPDYFAQVLAFAAAHPEVEMMGTARWVHNEASGEITDTHPLRRMFTQDRLVDLEDEPTYFHGSAPAAFVRRSRVESMGLTFDVRIKPNFEDGHFCTKYLLACDRPLVGFLGSAVYNYRKRADASSTLNNSVAREERYLDVPRYGYLDVLRTSAARDGRAARWVQNFVVYDLSWYFSAETSMGGTQTAVTGATADVFVRHLRDIADLLDEQVVTEFNLRYLDNVWRDILLHGLREQDWHAPYALVGPRDRPRRLIKVTTRFWGTEPPVVVSVDGDVRQAVHSKIRAHRYFDRDAMYERVGWYPLGKDLAVTIAGQEVPQLKKWPRPDPLPPLRQPTDWERRRRAVDQKAQHSWRRARRLALKRGPWARDFRDAWVLMDRIHDADDSGEHLFRYLRQHRPDINAWFVVEKGTPDWTRLQGEYGDRIVAHGSRRWLSLMLSCKNLISSHVDAPVHRPPAVLDLLPGRQPTWRFSFLQHGVIKDDLSRWLNPKAVHLFVTSTPGEQASVVGDGTPYAYTTRETVMTGLPRFDKLLRVAAEIADGDRRTILVAPTWRHWLLPPLQKGSQRRTVREDFLDTEYAQQWLGLLRSDRLAQLCREHDVTVGFLPHPNLQSVLPSLDLPPHVTPLSFTDDVQRHFARAAVLVTDYSSMAFNAAYLDRPVVYFQFDAKVVQTGGHVGRKGYFDYERDGFGPVVESLPGALDAIAEIVARGGVPAPTYLERNAATFVHRDGRCCERVTAAIEALHRPWDQA